MKKPIIILDPGKIWYKLDELHPAVDNIMMILKEHPEIASTKFCKISHYTLLDYMNIVHKDVEDIQSMVKKGRTRDY